MDSADLHPIEEPHAELERRLIDEFLLQAGHQPRAIRGRTDDAARALLKAAATHAAAKLTEVEARSHYVRHLHGQE